MNQSTIDSVFLIDDDPITNLINTKIILRNLSTEIKTFLNAEMALAALKQLSAGDNYPHIIFLDINMPIMDGWDFLDEYEKLPAQQLQNCRLYLLSSSINKSDKDKAKSFPSVKDFITKPLTPDMLTSLLKCSDV
jgi:CheY-like chemotaxis protein